MLLNHQPEHTVGSRPGTGRSVGRKCGFVMVKEALARGSGTKTFLFADVTFEECSLIRIEWCVHVT